MPVLLPGPLRPARRSPLARLLVALCCALLARELRTTWDPAFFSPPGLPRSSPEKPAEPAQADSGLEVPAVRDVLLGDASSEEGEGTEAATGAQDASSPKKVRLIDVLRGKDKGALWQLRQFTAEQGDADPEAVKAAFLAQYQEGSLPVPDLSPPELIEKFRNLESSDSHASWHWHIFGNEKAFGIHDPEKVPAEVLESFLSAYQAGKYPPFELATTDMVEMLDAFLRDDAAGQWKLYRRNELRTSLDSKRLPAEVLQQFLSNHRPIPKPETKDPTANRPEKALKGVSAVSRLGNLINRLMTADNLEYTFASEAGAPITATVALSDAVLTKLEVDQPRSFVGEPCDSQKAARDSAAQKALASLEPTLPARGPKTEAQMRPRKERRRRQRRATTPVDEEFKEAVGLLHNTVMGLLEHNPKPEDINYSIDAEGKTFTASVSFSDAVGKSLSVEDKPVTFVGEPCSDWRNARARAAAKALAVLKPMLPAKEAKTEAKTESPSS